MQHLSTIFRRALVARVAVLAAMAFARRAAAAEAPLLVEADSGKVLHAENATYPWYPASITKLMTIYVTLRGGARTGASRSTRCSPSRPTRSRRQPVQDGLPGRHQVTVDNALKMLMVKSANDMAVVLAEGVSRLDREIRRRDERATRAASA